MRRENLQEKLSKAKARSEVYATMQDNVFIKNEVATNEEFKSDQAASNTKATAGVHQQILKPQRSVSHDIKGQYMYQMLSKARPSNHPQSSHATGPAVLQMPKQKVPYCSNTLMERSAEFCVACYGSRLHQMWISRPLQVIH